VLEPGALVVLVAVQLNDKLVDYHFVLSLLETVDRGLHFPMAQLKHLMMIAYQSHL